MISKRTLEKWRKEALIIASEDVNPEKRVLAMQIVDLTRILLDQHLLGK